MRLLCLVAAAALSVCCHAGIPLPAQHFANLVDHFAAPTDPPRTFQQRYYQIEEHFGGPGSPIILIVGGEGAVEPSTGVFYPWVGVNLAERLHALVVQPEHRFYGTSNPAGPPPFSRDALRLLTPQQALADTAALIEAKRRQFGCTARGTPGYCPAITLGGSYPGWLSAMMRLRYPAVVDMAYSASAPTLMYAQRTPHAAYYAKVTQSAERALPGCPAAVRAAIADYLAIESKAGVVQALGLCTSAASMPHYIAAGGLPTLQRAVNMVLMYTFASLNMENYPPNNETALARSCAALVARPTSAGLRAFLLNQGQDAGRYRSAFGHGGERDAGAVTAVASAATPCFNMSAQLAAGPRATISAGDFSGVGAGLNGESWDYETCTLLVERIETNNKTDMFPARVWSDEWLAQHCKQRFGVAPQPRRLADLWGFDDMAALTSRIVFTNGLNDGWSVGSVLANLSDSLVAINMPNGAHHSDLSHDPPGPRDTPDVTAARAQATALLERWLHEISVSVSV